MKTSSGTLLVILALFAISCTSEQSTTEQEQPEVEAEPMPWAFLTAGVYHNNATVIIGQDPGENPNKGRWMDLHDDGTYDYGLYSKKEGTGKWFYDHDNALLELTPGGEQRPSEWRVMSRDDNLILVGTSKYGNNAQQLRYSRRDGLPSEE